MNERDLMCCGRCGHHVNVRLKPRQKAMKKFYRYLCEKIQRNTEARKFKSNLQNRCMRNSNILNLKCTKCSWRKTRPGQTVEMRQQQKADYAALGVRLQDDTFQSPATSSEPLDCKKKKKLKKKLRRMERRLEKVQNVSSEMSFAMTVASSKSEVLDKRSEFSLANAELTGAVTRPLFSTPSSRNSTLGFTQGKVKAPVTPTTPSMLSLSTRAHSTAKTPKSQPSKSTPASREKKGKLHQQLQLLLQKEKEKNSGKQSLGQFLESLQ